MKKLTCGILILTLCLACAWALAEDGSSLAAIDGEEDAVLTAEPGEQADGGAEAGAPSQAPADSDGGIGGDEEGPRWTYAVSLRALHSPYLLLVNADNLLEEDYAPDPLIKMSMVKRATSATLYMEQTAAEALETMFDAAREVTEYAYVAQNSKGAEVEKVAEFSDGMKLFLKSAYRSYGTQKTTYANYLARNNNVDDGYVAKPGASEHQSGLCADILNEDYAGRDRMTQDFKWTPEAQWMKENCAEFGFILRFPEDKENETGIKFEPWHFRYVGREAAGYIMSKGISLEEFCDEWQFELAQFIGRGGDVDAQIAYEESRLNAPPESFVLNEYGEDGDAEVSLVF